MKIDEPVLSSQSIPETPHAAADAGELRQRLMAALEGLLFVHGKPLSTQVLAETLGIAPEDVMPLLLSAKENYDADPKRGLQIVINEQGVQLATKAAIAAYIQKLEGQKLVNLSLPALETLAVIAYKQPLTRAEVEAIRGVNCDGVISTLLEKKLIYVSGEKPVIGKPRLYSTTSDFLYYFGIKSLKELPVPAVDVDPAALKENAAGETPNLAVEGVRTTPAESAAHAVAETGEPGASPEPASAPASVSETPEVYRTDGGASPVDHVSQKT